MTGRSRGGPLARLKVQGAHYRRRLNRIGALAEDGRFKGGGAGYEQFPQRYAYIEGLADAYDQALAIINDDRVEVHDIDMNVIALAKDGLDVDVIAARCGVTVRQVAENLILYVSQIRSET